MKQNYWLYLGNKLITGVRMLVGATDTEVINHALEQHNAVPNVSALWPENSHGAIARMICNSRVERV